MKHEIKIEKPYYDAVLEGNKTFEIRHNDRGYQKGDEVVMTPVSNTLICSGKKINAVITYVTGYQQKDNFVVFGFRLADKGE